MSRARKLVAVTLAGTALCLGVRVPSALGFHYAVLMDPVGHMEGEQLGGVVGAAGDVNGDGYADVIAGAHLSAGGRAYVYYGGPAADDVADLTLTAVRPGEDFGWSVSTAGDVNGDGYADIIVGELGYPPGSEPGRAYVYFGGPSPDAVPDLMLTANVAGDTFGDSVGAAGDVNGDGYDDVIVGAPADSTGGTNTGRAYVYYGGASPDAVADLVLAPPSAGEFFGDCVNTAGDVNGDGYADVIVGAYRGGGSLSPPGRAYVFYGGPSPDAVADLTLTGEGGGDSFGRSLGTAGDVNGDGYADIIVGARLNNTGFTDAGRAYVFYGGSSPNAYADLRFTGTTVGEWLGHSVGTAGDLNLDGHADLIMTAPGYDFNGTSVGRAFVYWGGTAIDTFAVAQPGVMFGWSAGTAGDVNGDGFPDLIVGVPGDDTGGANAGRFYVYARTIETGVEAEASTPKVAVRAPFPNPSPGADDAVFSFSLAGPDRIRLEVYDVHGRLVAARPFQAFAGAGAHEIRWKPRGLATGVYNVRYVTSTGRSHSVKWTIIR